MSSTATGGSGDDWAMEVAKDIRVKWMRSALLAEGDMALPKGHLSDIAEALRHAEATGYTHGHEAGEKSLLAKGSEREVGEEIGGEPFSEFDITQAMIQAGRHAANLNDGTLAAIYVAMRNVERTALLGGEGRTQGAPAPDGTDRAGHEPSHLAASRPQAVAISSRTRTEG